MREIPSIDPIVVHRYDFYDEEASDRVRTALDAATVDLPRGHIAPVVDADGRFLTALGAVDYGTSRLFRISARVDAKDWVMRVHRYPEIGEVRSPVKLGDKGRMDAVKAAIIQHISPKPESICIVVE